MYEKGNVYGEDAGKHGRIKALKLIYRLRARDAEMSVLFSQSLLSHRPVGSSADEPEVASGGAVKRLDPSRFRDVGHFVSVMSSLRTGPHDTWQGETYRNASYETVHLSTVRWGAERRGACHDTSRYCTFRSPCLGPKEREKERRPPRTHMFARVDGGALLPKAYCAAGEITRVSRDACCDIKDTNGIMRRRLAT